MSSGVFRSRPRGYRPRGHQAEPAAPPPGSAALSDAEGPAEADRTTEPDTEAAPQGEGGTRQP